MSSSHSLEDQLYQRMRALGYTTSSQTLELVALVKSLTPKVKWVNQATTRSSHLDTKENWEKLARMSVAAMQMGLRIEQDNGHRFIYADKTCFMYRDSADPTKNPKLHEKQYGSFLGALTSVDEALVASQDSGLIARSQDLDHYDDLGTLLGTGDVE